MTTLGDDVDEELRAKLFDWFAENLTSEFAARRAPGLLEDDR